MVEVGGNLREYFFWSFQDILRKFFSGVVGDWCGFIVRDVFGDEQFLPGVGHGYLLLFDLGVVHAGFELVVDGSVDGYSFFVYFFIIFSSDS